MRSPSDCFSLEGRTILLIGATGSIGEACAELLEAQGAAVLATGRRPEALERLRAKLRHERSRVFALDLEDEAARAAACAGGPLLDGVVFASGVSAIKPLRAQPEAEIRRILRINFEGPALLARELLRTRRLADGASLVFIGSVAGQIGAAGHAAYSASKAALAGFTRSLAVEVAARRIRVNTVSPGLVESAMAERMSTSLTGAQAAAYAERYPLGLGQPGDVAPVVAFLLSPAARWITGTDLVVDGGSSYARQ